MGRPGDQGQAGVANARYYIPIGEMLELGIGQVMGHWGEEGGGISSNCRAAGRGVGFQ